MRDGGATSPDAGDDTFASAADTGADQPEVHDKGARHGHNRAPPEPRVGIPAVRRPLRGALTIPAAPLTSLAAGAVGGALALVGCGGASTSTTTSPTRTVEAAQVESGIDQQLSTPTTEVTSVTCPDDVKAETGATFNCSVTWSNGATGKVKVTQESLNHFTYEPVSGSVQVPAAPVEKSIEQELAKQGAPDAQANCPDNIIVKVGTTVTCDLSGAGGQAAGTVTFTFSDASGTVDPSSVKTA